MGDKCSKMFDQIATGLGPPSPVLPAWSSVIPHKSGPPRVQNYGFNSLFLVSQVRYLFRETTQADVWI